MNRTSGSAVYESGLKLQDHLQWNYLLDSIVKIQEMIYERTQHNAYDAVSI